MASQASLMELRDRISRCHSSAELVTIIDQNPSVLLSNASIGTIIQSLPNILSGESAFNYRLVYTIANVYTKWSLGHLPHNEYFHDYNSPNDTASWTWVVDLLSGYVRTLARITDGRCYERYLAAGQSEFLKQHPVIRSAEEFMGWVYLVFDYTLDHGYDRDLGAFLKSHSNERERIVGFLYGFNDVCNTLDYVSSDAVEKLADLWADSDIRHSPVEKFGVLNNDCFVARCRDHDANWLLQELTRLQPATNETDAKTPEDTVQGMMDLFMILGNAFADTTVSRAFLFEYLSDVVTQELSQKRIATLERFEPMFGEDAIAYMTDFSSEVIARLSNVHENELQQSKMAHRLIDRRVESIVTEMHAMHPDVKAEDVAQFFLEVNDCFGHEFRLKNADTWSSIAAIIKTVYDKSTVEAYMGDGEDGPRHVTVDPADESIDALAILAAMEGSYGPDDTAAKSQKNQPAPKRTNSAGTQIVKSNQKTNGPTLQNGSVHRTAGTQQKAKTAEAVNSAERRLYSSYRKFKDNEDKVDVTFNKGIEALKRAMVGDQQAILIEGKTFSVTGFLKKLFATVAIFNYSKIALLLSVVVTRTLKSKTRKAERRQLIMELEGESQMLEEKINDAKASNNNQAKYDLMRSKIAVENALKRLKYGMGAEIRRGSAMNADLKSSRQYDIKKYRG